MVSSDLSYLCCGLGFLTLGLVLLFGLFVVRDGLHGRSSMPQDVVIPAVNRVWL